MTSENHAIDVHAHFGDYQRTDNLELTNRFASADAETVVRRARDAKIITTIASPLAGLLPRGQANSLLGNQEGAEAVEATSGLLQWVIVNPLQPETYRQAAEMLDRPKCVGIKLHPQEHVYPIAEHGRGLFEFASQHDAVVLVHSGDPCSLPADFCLSRMSFSTSRSFWRTLATVAARRVIRRFKFEPFKNPSTAMCSRILYVAAGRLADR